MFKRLDSAAWFGVNPFHSAPIPARSEGVAGDPDTGYFWDDEEAEPMTWDEYWDEREKYESGDY